MFVSTRYRSKEEEFMDNFSMVGPVLKKSLDQIALINRRLGGNKATIRGLATLLKNGAGDRPLSIADLGCGSGDMLRAIADYARENKLTFKLTGIDANEFTVNYARELSAGYPEISYTTMDVLARDFAGEEFDVVIATLFLHHFTNEEIEGLLVPITKKAGLGIVINDLHRCRMAYYLFKLVSFFIRNPMVKNDGAVSVLRGFKKKELINISKKLKGTVSSIHWKWAFRYQWIIKKQ